MKTNKTIVIRAITLALLSAMASSAVAAPTYAYRVRVQGVKGLPGGTGTGSSTGSTSTGGSGGTVQPESGGMTPTGPGDGGLQEEPIITTVPAENETAYFSIAKSGLTYNPTNSTYSGSVTVTNISSEAVYGPLTLMFKDLPAGYTLKNPSGNYGGMNYMQMTSTGDPVMPGQQIVVSYQISGAAGSVSFNNLVYSGYVDNPNATPAP